MPAASPTVTKNDKTRTLWPKYKIQQIQRSSSERFNWPGTFWVEEQYQVHVTLVGTVTGL